MKKIMFFTLAVLIGCSPIPATPINVNDVVKPTPNLVDVAPSTSNIASLDYSQECPQICWLGIEPGVTTEEEAKKIMMDSNRIDQESYENYAGTLWVRWKSVPDQHVTKINISFKNHLVEGVTLNNFINMGDLVGLVGEPDEISVRQVDMGDSTLNDYAIYYVSVKTLAYINAPIENGPSLNDNINMLILSAQFDNLDFLRYHKDLRQPWLGFGSLEKYLKNYLPPVE